MKCTFASRSVFRPDLLTPINRENRLVFKGSTRPLPAPTGVRASVRLSCAVPSTPPCVVRQSQAAAGGPADTVFQGSDTHCHLPH